MALTTEQRSEIQKARWAAKKEREAKAVKEKFDTKATSKTASPKREAKAKPTAKRAYNRKAPVAAKTEKRSYKRRTPAPKAVLIPQVMEGSFSANLPQLTTKSEKFYQEKVIYLQSRLWEKQEEIDFLKSRIN